MALELVSYDDLKNLMSLDDEALTAYPSLEVIRDGVTFALEEYLGREFELIERTKKIFIGDTPILMVPLKGLPISIISSVTVVTLFDSDEIDDYFVTEYGVALPYPVRNCQIDIVYTGGLITIPNNLKRAALLQTTYEFQTKDNIGASSVSTDGGYVSVPELGLLTEVQRMVKTMKHPLMWI